MSIEFYSGLYWRCLFYVSYCPKPFCTRHYWQNPSGNFRTDMLYILFVKDNILNTFPPPSRPPHTHFPKTMLRRLTSMHILMCSCPYDIIWIQHFVGITTRLAGGPTPYEGRVEVYINGSWGTVSVRHWIWNDASTTVVCRSLGYLWYVLIFYHFEMCWFIWFLISGNNF